MFSLALDWLLTAEQPQNALAFTLLFRRVLLMYESIDPILKVPRDVGIGDVSYRIPGVNRIHYMRVLIGYFPEDFAPDGFLDFGLADRRTLLIPVKNHSDLVLRYMVTTEIIGVMDYIAYGRDFRHCER